uniref:hypothetical protein n=1 Tax=Nonomuraea sp. CA-251285 TaxID=3240002 RepID=UPI003F496205
MLDLSGANKPFSGFDYDYVLFSYGMGVDSTAILLRWILEPWTAPFPLKKIIVLIAQTGDEWPLTGLLVEKYVFPLLRRHGIRTVQVARKTASQVDGIAVLADTHQPIECHLEGAYKLSDEMFAAGTVPQTGGARLCSAKAKGWPLDQFTAGLTQGRPYLHVIGFEANELSRVKKDREEGPSNRIPSYPLVDWGWDRKRCEDYIREVLGVEWVKSACSFCPFALGSIAGRKRTLARFIEHPREGMHALLMEWSAVALNPNMGLMRGDRVYDALADVPGGPELLERFQDYLNELPHAVWEVRRVLRPRKAEPEKMANAVRSVRKLAEGTRRDMDAELARLSVVRDVRIVTDPDNGMGRVWQEKRKYRLGPYRPFFPSREHMLVVGPAVAIDKTNDEFNTAWQAAELELARLADSLVTDEWPTLGLEQLADYQDALF